MRNESPALVRSDIEVPGAIAPGSETLSRLARRIIERQIAAGQIPKMAISSAPPLRGGLPHRHPSGGRIGMVRGMDSRLRHFEVSNPAMKIASPVPIPGFSKTTNFPCSASRRAGSPRIAAAAPAGPRFPFLSRLRITFQVGDSGSPISLCICGLTVFRHRHSLGRHLASHPARAPVRWHAAPRTRCGRETDDATEA